MRSFRIVYNGQWWRIQYRRWRLLPWRWVTEWQPSYMPFFSIVEFQTYEGAKIYFNNLVNTERQKRRQHGWCEVESSEVTND